MFPHEELKINPYAVLVSQDRDDEEEEENGIESDLRTEISKVIRMNQQKVDSELLGLKAQGLETQRKVEELSGSLKNIQTLLEGMTRSETGA